MNPKRDRGLYATLHSAASAWLILLISLLLTVAAWYLANNYAGERARERFAFAVQDAHERILRRMNDYEQILRGGVAFFDASTYVSREDWRSYVDSLQINRYFPGLQGMGYAVAFDPSQSGEIEQLVRADGYPDFKVYPEGERDLMTSIIYLEPFDARNQRAFGYDMFSQETRREAMEYAYRNGLAGVSGKVILLQETDTDVQPGFLMYLPVYDRPTEPFATEQDRRERLKGFVYSPFRMKDLMVGILGSSSPEVTFTIYDENQLNEDGFLFSSEVLETNGDRVKPLFSASRKATLGSHTWTILFSSTERFETVTSTAQPTLIGLGGISVDFLLFLVILSLARNRALIARQADEIAVNQKLYRGIIEGCPDGFWILDSRGKILEINPAYCKLSGYGAEEVVGKYIVDFEAKHQPDEIEAHKREIMHSQWQTFRSEHRRKDGSRWPVEVLASYWPNQGGRFFVFLKDITQSLETENSLIEAKRRAEAANKAKSDFLANMSHEIRTPMTAVLGLTQLALEGELPVQTRDYLEKALHGSRALLGLLNDILDYSKIEAKHMKLTLDWVQLDRLLAGVRSLFEVQAEHAGLGFLILIERGVPIRIRSDSLRLGQVINNLVGNALKFSEKGQIRIQVRPGAVTGQNMELLFSVQDEGIGMSEEQMQQLFRPFTQVDTSAVRKFGGTGLGLSICDRLVKMMDGDICVESVPGVGTTFHFTIQAEYDADSILSEHPLEVLDGKIIEQEDVSLLCPVKGLRILVGEDNSTNQLIAMRLLENNGAHVDVAGHGKEVLEALKHKPYDVLLLDLQMPEMDGIECAQKIRAFDSEIANIPILAMTAAVREEDQLRCVEVGMNGFVGKPFEKRELLCQIAKVTGN